MQSKHVLVSVLVLLAAALTITLADAQGPQPPKGQVKSPTAGVGTAFTYQGQLKQNGNPVNGTCAFNFGLWDALTLGAQLGVTQTVPSVSVSNGLFTTPIDFGPNVFTGGPRWLGIAVNCGSGLTALGPRQALTPEPYALYASGNWGLSGNAGTSPALNFIGTTDNQPLVFKTNNAERMRLDSLGNLGLGTTAPTDKLTVVGDIHTIPMAFQTEGFEAVSFPPASWTTGGDANWTRDTSQFYEGAASAASGTIGGLQSTYLELDYTFLTPGYVRFNWKVSSEASWDLLMFCLDNNACNRSSGYSAYISGNMDWTEVSAPVAAGPHTLRWIYTKDSSVNSGSDKGWVDNVRLMNSGNVVVDNSLIVSNTLTVRNTLLASANTGLGTTTPTRRLDVNGIVGVFDHNARTLNAGVATEANAALIDIGINDGSLNRFGGTYTTTQQGGFMRVDSRAGAPLFGFFARPTATAGDAAQLGYIDSNGTVRFGLGTSQKFSLGGSGTFEIDAVGLAAGRVMIANDGKVGLGVTGPTYRLQLPNTPDVMGQGQANAWQTYSSRRYKSNIAAIPNALDKVEQLRGVTFDWNSNGKHDIGLVAEEVGKVIPEIVNYEPNGVDAQSLDYSRLVAVLIQATKEQQQEIDQQREQITALQRGQESQLAALKEQNASLEARLSVLEQKTAVQSAPAPVASLDVASSLQNGNLFGGLGLLFGVVALLARARVRIR